MKEKTILIVDDDKSIRDALGHAFEKEGFIAIQAGNALQAMSQGALHQPDAIVLDLLMPGKNGLDCANDIRKEDWGKNIPIIILTSQTDQDFIATAIEEGLYDFHIKNQTSLEALVGLINEKLS